VQSLNETQRANSYVYFLFIFYPSITGSGSSNSVMKPNKVDCKTSYYHSATITTMQRHFSRSQDARRGPSVNSIRQIDGPTDNWHVQTALVWRGQRASHTVLLWRAPPASFHEIGMSRVAADVFLFDFRRRRQQYRRHQSNRKRGSECGWEAGRRDGTLSRAAAAANCRARLAITRTRRITDSRQRHAHKRLP